ncbi:oxidoreductase [Vibrio sp. 10N]|uniref:oxidoreductase n=1 Tax=Vibrio sp. 10N TaxID=3058938 RepID=UPI002812A482|nr:NAD(P)H-binding protein [Vibrio sp. 10N]
MQHNYNAIIAGSSGLVGSKLLALLEQTSHIDTIYALCRSPLDSQHQKTRQIMDGALRITDWDESLPTPTLGFICLGTTLHKAGSKAALEKIDLDLVCEVAQTMKLVGVKQIAVVSSLGASPRSLSHYLKCKGRVEQRIKQMGFEHVVFVRPGPLAGREVDIRNDEVLVQRLFSVLSPIMLGPLRSIAPIPAELVAKAMLYSVLQPNNAKYVTYNSANMRDMLSNYAN